jgi:hypothetical protein
MRHTRAVLAAALLAGGLAGASPASAQVGPDYVTSGNVEYIRSIKLDVGQTTGARIVGQRLYVTGAKNMSIYDISKPEDPQLLGQIHVNIAWENEEVPTNGKILGISNDWFDFMPSCGTEGLTQLHCLQLFDVRDPANVKELPAVPQNGDHTSECVLDCHYLYGSAGSITDLRGVFNGAKPKDLGDWRPAINAQLQARGLPNVRSCHHVREIRPGYLFAACQPFVYMRVVPENGDDASITNPKLLVAKGNADGRFVHSVRWPRGGRDKFAFEGGETNFKGHCDGTTNGALAALDASKALTTGTFAGPLSEYRPKNGTYADGNVPANATGCSVHWFQEHPSFRDGGLIAQAAYDNGTRFLQVTPNGKIIEQGYFQPLGFETSSPKWVPGTDIVYSIDYARGIDVLRWKGDHYVPDSHGVVRHEPGRVRGTDGKQPVLPALTLEQKAFAAGQAQQLAAQGWFQGYCELAAERGDQVVAR